MLRSRSRSSTASPPSSPRAKRSTLSMASIANIFIQTKRLQANALRRANQTVIVSGEPTTHPSVVEEAQTAKRMDVEYDEEYICIGGVNLPTLLRASRHAMLEHCYGLASCLNALVDEQWECTISSPKPGHSGPYKVVVRYMAAAIQSSVPDPHMPVHLNQAKGVPGLMTIVSRKGAA
ncbi:hypothetical protein D9619_008049 [Psilocybe cf. subviscida]|uniref:Uncharacterized protein n=1 Tax=Psilocybe cf. subviscida TaxID=2480587 RepID=A0A8H5ATX7_9AGAR|nr:hypothetical protein D9619_008049 [Psilocybe cf. subviscida]